MISDYLAYKESEEYKNNPIIKIQEKTLRRK